VHLLGEDGTTQASQGVEEDVAIVAVGDSGESRMDDVASGEDIVPLVVPLVGCVFAGEAPGSAPMTLILTPLVGSGLANRRLCTRAKVAEVFPKLDREGRLAMPHTRLPPWVSSVKS